MATAKHTEIVTARALRRTFNGETAVSGVDLEITAGEVIGVVGPNGGGKSTLLLLMAGLLKPTAGSIAVCGIDAHSLALTQAGLVGLVTARPGLYPLLTGRENLRHFGRLFGLQIAEIDRRAEPLLADFRLDDGIDRRVAEWSTGMQQKLSLVRALLLSPRLLLFDEPTANLDPIASRALYCEIGRRAKNGLACVLATHDLPAAEMVCHRVLLLNVVVQRELEFFERDLPEPGPLLAAWQETLDQP